MAPIILTYKWHHHNTVVLYTVSNSQSEFIIGAVRRIDKLDFHNLCFVIALKDKKTDLDSLPLKIFELCLSMPVSVFLPDLKVVADWLIVALVELVVDLGL